MLLRAWQRTCTAAKTSAVRGFRKRSQVRRANVRIDEDLVDTSPDVWADEIDQVLFQARTQFGVRGASRI
jgi:hypothetical protein